MTDAHLDAIATDLTALEAIVRALARCYACRSRSALTELLESLSIELERIRSSQSFEGIDRAGVSVVLEAWIEDLKVEALMSEASTV